MVKYFKKFNCIFLILIMLVVNFAIPFSVEKVQAKTLRDLKTELSNKEQELSNSKNQKKFTEEEIEKKKKGISAINVEISNIRTEMESLTKEIEELSISIIEKEKEIKDIMNYYQVSNGNSAYLEYIFDAADYTDFIYRLAIAEQLSTYNNRLIDEYNETIKNNEQKKKDLSNKTVELNNKQKSLEKELASLGTQLGEIMDENVTIEDDIKSLKEMINTYENVYKCGLDDDIDTCSTGLLPPGTAFYRPVTSGMVSANYGIYYPWGYAMQHYGMDIGGVAHGTPVYSMANGKVSFITRKAGCGGNMVYIHHTVNGKEYTTGYFHLASINVQVGEVVTSNTVIGTVGGNEYIETWDSCSTGTHLHIQFAEGHIVVEPWENIGYYTKFTSKHFNPRNEVNFPCEGCWFTNRNIKY